MIGTRNMKCLTLHMIPSTMISTVAHDRAAADPVHSRTAYSNATPSGSFSSTYVSAASAFANTLR